MLAHTSKPLSFAMTLDENLDVQSFVRRCTTVPVFVNTKDGVPWVDSLCFLSSDDVKSTSIQRVL
jgi:hypothetical protein